MNTKEVSPEVKAERERVKQIIIERSTEYFERDRSGKGFICPICGSGSGPKGTGITEAKKAAGHFTCWAGCFQNADIFEIIGKQYGLEDFNDQFNRACEIFQIEPDYKGYKKSLYPSRAKEAKEEKTMRKEEDFTEFYAEAAANLNKTDYYRGLSLDTLKKFNIGFMPNWKATPTAPASPRLIIPRSKFSYLARDTRANLTDTQKKFEKMDGGPVNLFNLAALRQSEKPVYIVEGELDALSIIDAGGEAVALCGVANAGKLINALNALKERENKIPPLIIALDNDGPGQEASPKLARELEQAGFSSYRNYSPPEPFKDPNDFLMKDRAKFIEWVRGGTDFDFASKEKAEGGEDTNISAQEEFEKESASYYIPDLLAMVKANKERLAIPAGFKNLDSLLDGGLYSGLYFIGAISSLGKTTLALQIADNVAQSGHGVLIFSLEMARLELMAKSISRLSFIKSYEKYKSAQFAKTTRGFLRGEYNSKEGEIIRASIMVYAKWAKNIHITEGIGNVGTAHIRSKIEEYLKFNEVPPVVVVDYTQILAAPESKRSLTDKQVVDLNVLELKRISRDFDTPLISISSFNRENYSSPVNMASFKESGAIEYSSDVLIGLQYNGWDYREGEKDTARMERLRNLKIKNEEAAKNLSCQDIQLKVLKNRNGKKGSCTLNFYPAFNYFCE